jgi:hypothetical protein
MATDAGAAEFMIVPGPPIAEICEEVYTYTSAHPDGVVVADIDTFEAISVSEVMRLLTELPRVERFVNENFRGTFLVRNAGWAVRTAVGAVFGTVIRAAAPGTRLECPA